VFEGLSRWGDGAPYFIAFAVIFNWEKRSRAFYYIIFLSAVSFLMNVTKMAYHEPRPFMVTTQIKVYGCSAEYGNPSGHSLFAAGFNFFFFLDICHGTKYRYSKPIYFTLLVLAIFLTVTIGFARFYVGVHTLN
jgi:membrane-associated phospholipid phosphatase